MKTVHKFPFDIEDQFEMDLPEGAVILHAECQGNQPCLWVLVVPSRPLEKRKFRIYGTGHPIRDDMSLVFIATFQQPPFVWHLFEFIDKSQSLK